MTSADNNAKDIMEKIYRLIDVERKQEPSPWLAARIEDKIMNAERQTQAPFFQQILQPAIACLVVILSATLGFQLTGKETVDKVVPEQTIYFNEMELEYPERVLLK